jgi:hypothetical protein
VAFGVLSIALVGLATIGWNRLDQQRAALGDAADLEQFGMIQSEIRSLDERVSTLAGRMVADDVVDALSSKVAAIEASLGRDIDAARAEIAALEAEVAESDRTLPETIDLAVEDHASLIRARVGELEALIRDRETVLDDLAVRIDTLRGELRLDLADLERRTDMVDRGFDNRIGNAERRLDVVAYAVDRARVDFEMFTEYAEELTPGIRLYLSEIHRDTQRVSGWVHLVPEGRIVRIREHPIQEAFTFYTHQDERSHELVFTRVTRTAAVGSMRVPPESFVESADADWTEPSVALAVD